MVIRVSGYPGSGKTTLCKRLAEMLGYDYYAGSTIFRQMAVEKGMSIEDFYKSLASNPEFEKEADAKTEALMAAKEDLIVEGRVAPFLPCPHPHVNVLLMAEQNVAAERNLKRPENTDRTLEYMRTQTEERVTAVKKHFQDLYGIENHFDPSAYDLIIDTSAIAPDEVFQKTSAFLNSQS